MGKKCRPISDAISYHVASDQDLYCLLTGFSIKNRIKATNIPDMTNGLAQHIVVESTSIQRVKAK